MTQLQDKFKQAMSRFGTGVCVITYERPATGLLEGVTISAFSSLSLEPTKILFCLGKAGQCHEDLQNVEHFAVNILSGDQAHLCYQFAGKNREGLEHFQTEIAGVPALKGTLASIVCKKGNQYAEGDHDIIIGEVLNIELYDDNLAPLLYYKSKIIEDYQHVE